MEAYVVNSQIDWLLRATLSIFTLILGYYIAKDKYVSQRTYDKKLDLLLELYKEVHQLEFELKKYTHFIGADLAADKLEEKNEALNDIRAKFHKFQHKFWEVEIILDDSTIKAIENFLSIYIGITARLHTSHRSQILRDYNTAHDTWDEGFDLVKNELKTIKEELKLEFRQTLRRS